MAKHGAGLRVGIVGAGMAGSSAAYFIRQRLGSGAEVVVYERGQTVGGRVQEIEIAGNLVAAGASIAHSTNRYFVGLVEALGLRQKRYATKTLGTWNGQRFGFRTVGARWRDRVQMLRRYGMSPLRAEGLVKQFLLRLVPVYDLLDQGRGFADPQELFSTLGLYELSRQSSGDYFRRQGVSSRFLEEIIDGVSRSNYGQGSEIHALVNLVSLAGAAMGGYLLSVQEGNSAVCRGLLQASGATVRTGTAVAEVSCLGGLEYTVTTAGGDTERFDAVIVAAPLELAGIRFAGVTLPKPSWLARPFQVTHVTFVVGQLSPGYFGLRTAAELPATIMTRDSHDIPFSGIGTWGKAPGSDHTVYKVFSRQELSEELLSRLFSLRVHTLRIVWQAYPILRPETAWPPFVLNRGLYYVNAMESGVSTMETEIMASRNAVNLLMKDFC
ncbi:MAG: FAD-dependent oxidoreductase [Bacillota bacterium]|nr:FAD-dependent oxidoreductase [Bacillota bacterium]